MAYRAPSLRTYGPLAAPNGDVWDMLTVWQVNEGQNAIQFITAFRRRRIDRLQPIAT